MNHLTPIILEGNHVKLMLLQENHRDDLINAEKDGQLSELWFTLVPTEEQMDAYIKTATQDYNAKTSLPFVVINKKTNKIIGTTRYCNIDRINKRLEIGHTWYSKSQQKTGINTGCKYLLLQHAFEDYGVIAVEFRTHWHNQNSRNAILRLGAKQDGILRNHRRDQDGSFRDTVVFSIIESEWKTVKKSLEYNMKKYESRKE